MSDHSTAASTARHSNDSTPLAPLIALGVAAAVAAFALIRVSADSASSWLGIVLGVAVALGAGLALGRWWPRALARRTASRDDAATPTGGAHAEDVDREPTITFPEPAADGVSALHDEEHVFGAASDATEPSALEAEHDDASDEQSVPNLADELAEKFEQKLAQEGEPPAELGADLAEQLEGKADALADAEARYEQGHLVITPNMLINDDHPTVAMHIPAAEPVAIDDKPESEALAAKDEVIRTLENIVKENRDRWADFDAERERLKNRIRDLEAELRVASDLLEHGTDQDDSAAVPQVLNQL